MDSLMTLCVWVEAAKAKYLYTPQHLQLGLLVDYKSSGLSARSGDVIKLSAAVVRERKAKTLVKAGEICCSVNTRPMMTWGKVIYLASYS